MGEPGGTHATKRGEEGEAGALGWRQATTTDGRRRKERAEGRSRNSGLLEASVSRRYMRRRCPCGVALLRPYVCPIHARAGHGRASVNSLPCPTAFILTHHLMRPRASVVDELELKPRPHGTGADTRTTPAEPNDGTTRARMERGRRTGTVRDARRDDEPAGRSYTVSFRCRFRLVLSARGVHVYLKF